MGFLFFWVTSASRPVSTVASINRRQWRQSLVTYAMIDRSLYNVDHGNLIWIQIYESAPDSDNGIWSTHTVARRNQDANARVTCPRLIATTKSFASVIPSLRLHLQRELSCQHLGRSCVNWQLHRYCLSGNTYASDILISVKHFRHQTYTVQRNCLRCIGCILESVDREKISVRTRYIDWINWFTGWTMILDIATICSLHCFLSVWCIIITHLFYIIILWSWTGCWHLSCIPFSTFVF